MKEGGDRKSRYDRQFIGAGCRLWDDAAFQARVHFHAGLAHKSVAEVCLEAGLAADYLNKHAAKSGRSIEAILRLAAVLDISAAKLIGIEKRKRKTGDCTRSLQSTDAR
jgi:hypothetical protein